MKNKGYLLKDTASVISGALSTFSDLKNEIDNIIRSRFEKFINSQGIVNREDFEALIDRHNKLEAEFNLFKIKFLKKSLKTKEKNNRRTTCAPYTAVCRQCWWAPNTVDMSPHLGVYRQCGGGVQKKLEKKNGPDRPTDFEFGRPAGRSTELAAACAAPQPEPAACRPS